MEQTLVVILKRFELYFMGASMGWVVCKNQRFYWPTWALSRRGEQTKNRCPLSSLSVFSLNFCYSHWWQRKALWQLQKAKRSKRLKNFLWLCNDIKSSRRASDLFALALWTLHCRGGIFFFEDHLMCYVFLHTYYM